MSVLFSCAETPKKEYTTEEHTEVISNSDEKQSKDSSEDVEATFEQLGGLLNMGNKDGKNDENEKLPEVEALEKLLQMSGKGDQGSVIALQDLLTKDFSSSELIASKAILKMLEASGVSQEQMEKLLSNPDSLKTLAKQAIENRELKKEIAMGDLTQGQLSEGQLKSKSTPTGVSLEEAIRLVQAESGIEATLEKLKEVDSLAGTNTMEMLDLETAQQVFDAVEQKNKPSITANEKIKKEALRRQTGQLHSDKEAVRVVAELEQTEADIASGKVKATPEFTRYITNRRKVAKIFSNDFNRKSQRARKKFRKLNPDLYFGEEAGTTYVGSGADKTPVYLPLGKLAFVDKVIEVNHPKQLTNNRNEVIGEPDVLYGFEVEDVTGMYSLGYDGDMTVQFIDNALTDVNGPDLYVFEFGAIEPTDLEISKDGKKWIRVGKIDGGVAEVDIAEFVQPGELFYYVRLKDLKKVTSLPGADIDAIGAIGSAMRLNLDSKVLFETGKSELKPEGIEALKILAQSITVLKRGNVIIEGHTDDVGSEATNQKLSLARAKSVSTELKKLIPSKNYKWQEKGLGESKPLVENDSDKNRAKNRRVEVLVLPN